MVMSKSTRSKMAAGSAKAWARAQRYEDLFRTRLNVDVGTSQMRSALSKLPPSILESIDSYKAITDGRLQHLHLLLQPHLAKFRDVPIDVVRANEPANDPANPVIPVYAMTITPSAERHARERLRDNATPPAEDCGCDPDACPPYVLLVALAQLQQKWGAAPLKQAFETLGLIGALQTKSS